MSGRPLTAQNEVRFRPDLAVERAGRDDGNRECALRRETGAGVHNMAPGFAFGHEELFVTAGSGERLVFQSNSGRGFRLTQRVFDPDGPAGGAFGRIAEAVDAAASGGNQSSPNAIGAQNLDHTIDCIAFADAARIEVETGLREGNSSTRGVEHNVPVANLSHCLFDCTGPGKLSRTLVESPDLHQGAHRNIESTFAPTAVVDAVRKQVEELF